jgi:hypothetical protein
MCRNGQHQRYTWNEEARQLANFYKDFLGTVRYAGACVIVALVMAYLPASALNALTEIDVVAGRVTASSEVSTRDKADRPSSLSFEQRWRAVPSPSTLLGRNTNERETPRVERREKIPFTCELAFSRLITKGNFSTRCIAGLESSTTYTRPEC